MFMDRKTQYGRDVISSLLDLWLNMIPIKRPANYYVAVNELLLKFIWKVKRPGRPSTAPKNKVGERAPRSHDHLEAAITEAPRDGQWTQQTRRPRGRPSEGTQPILTEEQRKKMVFSTDGAGKTGHPHTEEQQMQTHHTDRAQARMQSARLRNA